jgi:hypothetical protein
VGNLGSLWLNRRGGRERILRAGLTVRLVVAAKQTNGTYVQPSNAAVKANARNFQVGDESQQISFPLELTRLREEHLSRQKLRCRNLHFSKRTKLSTIPAGCPHSGTALERSRRIRSTVRSDC